MKNSLETMMARLGSEPETPSESETGALSPSIHLATTFSRDERGEHPAGYVYSRIGNPTRNQLESALATMESGHAALAFSSGMAAANAIFQALKPGDRVLLPHDIYYGVRQLATDFFEPWGLIIESIDMSDLEVVADALGIPTTLIWLETPSNPQLHVLDLAAIGKLAKESGALMLVDNTWCTPLITRPIEFGADIVLHSVTKYFGGHSDVLGGALIFAGATELGATGFGDSEICERVRSVQQKAGAVLDPFSCWLAMRGIRSLAARLNRQCDSAEKIALFLESHPKVMRVHYPGLKSDPGYTIASSQMKRYGGMLSFEVRGSEADAKELASRFTLFANATSLGGTESLIEHRASVEGPTSPTPKTLLRVSVGLEAVSDLIDDLATGLDQLPV